MPDYQNTPDHYVGYLVHDLVVTISDLIAASRDCKTAELVMRERDELAAAQRELAKLVERITPVKVAAE